MACASNWRLLQYRVDTGVRKALFYHHKATLPKFMFDRTQPTEYNYYNPKSSITLGLYKLELWLCDLHQAA